MKIGSQVMRKDFLAIFFKRVLAVGLAGGNRGILLNKVTLFGNLSSGIFKGINNRKSYSQRDREETRNNRFEDHNFWNYVFLFS